jgi:hypothetical protein
MGIRHDLISESETPGGDVEGIPKPIAKIGIDDIDRNGAGTFKLSSI